MNTYKRSSTVSFATVRILSFCTEIVFLWEGLISFWFSAYFRNIDICLLEFTNFIFVFGDSSKSYNNSFSWKFIIFWETNNSISYFFLQSNNSNITEFFFFNEYIICIKPRMNNYTILFNFYTVFVLADIFNVK